jgi:hypothetical protein
MAREKRPLGRRLGNAALVVLALPFVLLLVLPLALAAAAMYFLHKMALYILVWALWLPKGKDVLVVYSDSPIWHDYMSAEVVPLVRERAVVLNWSERKKWPRWSFAAHVFRSFGGNRNFNPLVVVFRPYRHAEVFRFWSAFTDWKHGHTEPVELLRQRLLLTL